MPLATVVHKTRVLREGCPLCITVGDKARLSGESDPRHVLRKMQDAHESHPSPKRSSHGRNPVVHPA